MLQINANPNQNAIIMHSMYGHRTYQIQLLNSNEIYAFDIPMMDLHYKTLILVTSNGLVFVIVHKDVFKNQLLVFNLITKECIELPNSPYLWNYSYLACDFFNMICNLAHIRYFLLGIQVFTFIIHLLKHGKV